MFFTNTQSRLRPSKDPRALTTPHLMSLLLYSSRSNAGGGDVKLRPSKDDMSGQKALQGAKTETKELLGGTNVTNNLPLVIDLPIKQINDFLQKANRKQY